MAICLKDNDFGINNEFPLCLNRHKKHGNKVSHFHEFVEMVIIYHGTAVHYSDKAESTLKPGDVFIIPKGTIHGYKKSSNLSLINIMYDPARLWLPESDLRKLPGYHALFLMGADSTNDIKHMHLKQNNFDTITRTIERIELEINAGEPGFKTMALAYLNRLIVQLARFYDTEMAGKSPNERLHMRIATAISYIENNIERTVPISELLKLTNLSESSLLRAFKEAVGMGPLEYHIHQKIRRSCRLLRRSDLMITEIAFSVGFNDANYFTRQFRKRMGMSPKEYRLIPSF
jgi:AraC-like DNA-binding protein